MCITRLLQEFACSSYTNAASLTLLPAGKFFVVIPLALSHNVRLVSHISAYALSAQSAWRSYADSVRYIKLAASRLANFVVKLVMATIVNMLLWSLGAVLQLLWLFLTTVMSLTHH